MKRPYHSITYNEWYGLLSNQARQRAAGGNPYRTGLFQQAGTGALGQVKRTKSTAYIQYTGIELRSSPVYLHHNAILPST